MKLPVTLALLAVLAFAAAGCGGTKEIILSPASSVAGARSSWVRGTEAALPANAAVGRRQQAGAWAISCASAGNCSAIGTYDEASGKSRSVLWTEHAGRWERGVEASLPADASSSKQNGGLESISCGSAGNCLAVGEYTDSSQNAEGLLLSETGGRWWTGVEAALPANAATTNQSVSLRSVSCASTGSCSVVGSYKDSSGNLEGLLLTETGLSPAVAVEAALPANAAATNQDANIASVSCPSAGNCSAVGGYLDDSDHLQDLLLTETGGTWSTGVEAVLPANAVAQSREGAEVGSVSCASLGNCGAVGEYWTHSGGRGLLLTDTGGHWAAGVAAVLPPNAVAGRLDSFGPVSCGSAGNCSAVGAYSGSTGDGEQLLFISDKAGKWESARVAALPTNAVFGSWQPDLPSISCSSAGGCTAVGAYAAPQAEGLVVAEAAGRWSRGVKAALPANAALRPSIDPGLYSVSCPSNKYCGAAGVYLGHSGGTHGLLLGGTIPPPCVAPELKGKSLQAAKRLIRSHDCSIGTINYDRSRSTTRGRVISQKPRGGTQRTHGANVELVVSRGR